MTRLISFDRTDIHNFNQPAWAGGGESNRFHAGLLAKEARLSFIAGPSGHNLYNSDGSLDLRSSHLGTLIDLYC